jgi:hypothetical protein
MIPDNIRRFVLTSIPSVPYMEAVLLFHRMPEIECTARDIAKALYIPQARAEELLGALDAAGILNLTRGGAESAYRFAPPEPARLEAIEGLANAYRDDVVAITNLIHAAAPRNALRFADAFKFRKGR